ncbi:MAG: hypothetical protein Roseis2KO_23220 [Roseivirga sp.]
MYSFDRTFFDSFKAEDRTNDLEYWSQIGLKERLEAAYYLIAVAYKFDPENPPKMDKTIFEARRRD